MQENDHYLVTGAGRDLGQRIAVDLAAPGRTAVIHTHDAGGALRTKAMIEERGARAIVLAADFAKPAEVERFVAQAVAALGDKKFRTVILNAAHAAGTPMSGGAESAGALRTMLEINVLAPNRIVLGLGDHLADGASLVAVSVTSVRRVFSPDFGGFAASKAAIDCLVPNWAVAFGPRGIRVNSVSPGVFDANFRSELLKKDEFRKGLVGATALARVATIQDVADAVLMLTSEKARWITGQVIDASGGWRL